MVCRENFLESMCAAAQKSCWSKVVDHHWSRLMDIIRLAIWLTSKIFASDLLRAHATQVSLSTQQGTRKTQKWKITSKWSWKQ